MPFDAGPLKKSWKPSRGEAPRDQAVGACEIQAPVSGTNSNSESLLHDTNGRAVGLVDLGLTDGCGIQLIAGMARADLVLIALSVRFDDEAIFGALRAGAVGYLLKDASAETIARALRDAVAGGSPMSPGVARRVVRQFQPATDRGRSVQLTPREHEVLEFLCLGASYREIARTLGMACGTVQTHVKHVYEKLGADNKAEAVRIALESRLVPLRNVG